MAAHAQRRRARWLSFAVALVVLAALGAGGFLLTRGHGGSDSAVASEKPAVVPLEVVGTSPGANASNVPSSADITVDLSAPLAADSPMPTLSPAVAGSWTSLSPTELQFAAGAPLVPGTQETLTIPGGSGGLVSTQGERLASTDTVTFGVAAGSTLRLQQLLAQLGYLPLSFTPATQETSPTQAADPQQGTFAWRWANLPTSLTSLWTQGTSNVITQGAVMSFEDQNGLTTDGIAGPQVWTDLLKDAASGTGDTQPYGYVYVSEDLPENVTVYQNGVAVYNTLANTGIAASPTPNGTWPVYARYEVTTMSGTNPDGSTYVDPGIPWVSYFYEGDALHGYDRASYGFPQSLGCVEMPPANAEVVWPMTPIGTLVTVQ